MKAVLRQDLENRDFLKTIFPEKVNVIEHVKNKNLTLFELGDRLATIDTSIFNSLYKEIDSENGLKYTEKYNNVEFNSVEYAAIKIMLDNCEVSSKGLFEKIKAGKYVLSDFTPEELTEIAEMLKSYKLCLDNSVDHLDVILRTIKLDIAADKKAQELKGNDTECEGCSENCECSKVSNYVVIMKQGKNLDIKLKQTSLRSIAKVFELAEFMDSEAVVLEIEYVGNLELLKTYLLSMGNNDDLYNYISGSKELRQHFGIRAIYTKEDQK